MHSDSEHPTSDPVNGVDYAVLRSTVLEKSAQALRHLGVVQNEFDTAKRLFREATAARLVEMFVEAGWELQYYSTEDPHTVYVEPVDPAHRVGVELPWDAGFSTTVNTVELKSLNNRS